MLEFVLMLVGRFPQKTATFILSRHLSLGVQLNRIICYLLPKESRQVCCYEMQGPGIPPLHNSGSLSIPSATGSSSGHAPESPSQGSPHLHPHMTSGRNLEIIWSKSHLVMRMIEMRIGQEPLLQVSTACNFSLHCYY